MGRDIKHHKSFILIEIVKEKIVELFNTNSFKNHFDFNENNDYIFTNFRDSYDNNIRIMFHKIENNMYELDFTVNGSSYSSSVDYSLKDYTSLIKTVYEAVNQFLDEFSPKAIAIEGVDSINKIRKGKEGQKSLIYKYASYFLKPHDGYKILYNQNGNINIIKKQENGKFSNM